MFDTMTITKAIAAACGSLLIYLFGAWAAETLYHTEPHGEDYAQAYVIETGAEEATEVVEEGPPFAEIYAVADAAAGEAVFGKCKACHKVDGSNGVGPHLNGVVERQIAGIPDYSYSEVLAGMAADAWTPENMSGFLENPKGWAPGTKMAFAGLGKAEDRANVIAYLAGLQ